MRKKNRPCFFYLIKEKCQPKCFQEETILQAVFKKCILKGASNNYQKGNKNYYNDLTINMYNDLSLGY